MGEAGFDQPSTAAFDVAAFRSSLQVWCEPHRLGCSQPFLVSWYNQARDETADGTQRIEAPDSAVAFAIYSVPGYLNVVAEHFARERPESNFVDATTNHLLQQLLDRVPVVLEPCLVNTDVGPPFYHIQTIGAIAGVDQHLEAKDFPPASGSEDWREELSELLEVRRDPKMWGTDPATRRKIFGVNVHPVWGGWYAYRALLILKRVSAKDLCPPEPLCFLGADDARRILTEYNLKHDECLWRDLTAGSHAPQHRYLPEEFFFFTEVSPAKRRRYLELRAQAAASSRSFH